MMNFLLRQKNRYLELMSFRLRIIKKLVIRLLMKSWKYFKMQFKLQKLNRKKKKKMDMSLKIN